MRVWRCDATGLRLEDNAPPPRAEPGDAVVRPTRTAVAPGDVEAVRRHASGGGPGGGGFPPFVPGQEFVGVVESLADDADKATRERWVGKRVVGSPTLSCGACDLCRSGLSVHCRARRVLGRPGCDGTLAERCVVPVRNLVLVPGGAGALDDDRAVFACAVASALHCARVVRVEGKTHVTVLGDTVEGLITAQVLARLNASVRVLGSTPERLELCERWGRGIKHRHVDEAGRRQDQDLVIECTGSAAGLAVGLRMVRPRGSIVLQRPIAGADLAPVVDHEVTIVGAREGPWTEALALLARAEVEVLSLIGRRLRLADGGGGSAAAAFAAAGEPAALRVLVES